MTTMNELKRFREAAENCGFSVAETEGSIELTTMTPDGRTWCETFDCDDPSELEDILRDKIESWECEVGNDLWVDDDGETDPCESFEDDELWKLEQLTRLFNFYAI